MSKGTGSTVECPVCGEQFDPTAAGGWCTNPDCGEWRQEVDDGSGGEGSGETGAPAAGPDPSEEADPQAPEGDGEADTGDSFTRGGSENVPEDESAGEGSPPEDPAGADSGADDSWGAFEPADSGADEGTDDDATGDTTDEGASETPDRETPVEEGERADDAGQDGDDDLPGTAADDAGPAEPADDEGSETLTCPDCAAEVTGEAQFCPECGADVSSPPEAEEVTDDEQLACHDCGAEVAADDSFCASCGARADRDEEHAARFVSTEEQGDTEIVETEEGASFEGKPTAEDVALERRDHGCIEGLDRPERVVDRFELVSHLEGIHRRPLGDAGHVDASREVPARTADRHAVGVGGRELLERVADGTEHLACQRVCLRRAVQCECDPSVRPLGRDVVGHTT